jgi:putative transposase
VAVDDEDGAVADLPAAANQRSTLAAPDLPVSAAASGDRAGEPGLVRRHHLHPDAAWLPVSGGNYGLGDAQSAGVAAVEHDAKESGDVGFCVMALEEALARFGTPDIFNTDQGSQFTSFAFTAVLKDAEIRISMDGCGRWMDNVFIERLWRSMKYECVYLHAFETGSELRVGLTRWIGCYNADRPHSGLAGQTPDEACRANEMQLLAGLPPPAQTLQLAA